MEYNRHISNKETTSEEVNEKKLHVQDESNLNMYFNQLEETSQNKTARENVLKQSNEILQHYKQILKEKTEILNKINENNQQLSSKIKYEVQWRDRVVKNMMEAHQKLMTITSATDVIKSVTTLSEDDQVQFNQGKQQLLDWFALTKDENDIKYEQLIEDANLLSNEKLNMVEFNIQFQTENEDISSKINSKEQKINELKMKINDLKSKNCLSEKRNCTSFEIESILKKLKTEDLNWTTLKEDIENERMKCDEKIQTLNESNEENKSFITELNMDTEQVKLALCNISKILHRFNNYRFELLEDLSKLKQKHVSYKTEIIHLKAKYKSDKKEYHEKIYELNKKINDKQNQIMKMKDENRFDISTIFQDRFAIKNESLEYNNNQLEFTKMKLKEKEIFYNENVTNFENIIIPLKYCIKNEIDLNTNIEGELEDLKNEIAELNNEYKNVKINYDNFLNEASSVLEINQKLEIDKLKKTKNELQTEIEKVKLKMTQKINENDVKTANLVAHTKVYINETKRVSEINEEKRKEELEKIQEINSNMKLQIFGLKTRKECLEKKLAIQNQELAKIREKNEINIKKPHELIENKKEMDKNESFFIPVTKKPKMATKLTYYSDSDSSINSSEITIC